MWTAMDLNCGFWVAIFSSFFVAIVGLLVLLCSEPINLANPQVIAGTVLLVVGGVGLILFGILACFYRN